MNNIENFLSEVYSEESFNFSEEEYAEVMAASAVDYEGYSEWSEKLEGDLENFEIRGGKVHYKGEGQKRGPFINGIEI
jgi:hypothetical protein